MPWGASIPPADRVLVLDGGAVVESGSHEELMQGDTLYKRLYLRQASAAHSTAGVAGEVAHA